VVPTLRDVAEQAGVSVRTAAYAITNPERVGTATLARVLAVVDELNYRPNQVARGLRTGRTGLIGLVVPQVDVPYFAELARELIAVLAEHEMTLIIDQTDGDPARERELLSAGRAAAFDGLILSPLALTAADIAQRATTSPLVLLGERIFDSALDHVVIDNADAAYQATRHLIDAGYRSIAVIGRQHHAPALTPILREEGFVRAMTESGLDPYRHKVEVQDFGRLDGHKAMIDLLSRQDAPDAVFCFNDLLALGAQRAALSQGVRVPDELGIIGFDDIEDGRYATPTLSTIRPDKREIARATVDLLIARLNGSETPPTTHIVEFTLERRESTRPSRDR
jgi:DNA-binding LacI/PurR family transcriptional regulator